MSSRNNLNKTHLSSLIRGVALAATILTGATVQAGNSTPWYVGSGVGIANVKDMCDGMSTYDCDDHGSMARVFGGLHINKYFAVEATLDLAGNWRSPGARTDGYDGKTGGAFVGINLLGTLPVSSRLSLYSGVSGAFAYTITDTTEDQYNHHHHHDHTSDSSVVGGVLTGLDVKVTRHFHVRAQAQRDFNVKARLAFDGHRDVDMFSIGAAYQFR